MNRRLLWLVLLAVLIVALAAPAAAVAGKPMRADMVLIHGKVYTVDDQGTVAQAVAIKGGKIVYVGTTKHAVRMIGPKTKLVNMRGKLLLPGFIDAHAHASYAADELFTVYLYGLGAMDKYLAAIAEFAAANPDMTWISGSGWSNTVVPGIGPLATDLDTAVPDRPALMYSEDGHSIWVNTLALEAAGITGATKDPEGGVIERLPGTEASDPPYGTPSGTLRESAEDLVAALVPEYTVDQWKQGIDAYQSWYAGPLGTTTVFNPGGSPDSNMTAAYEEMAQAGALTVTTLQALTLSPEDQLAATLASFKAEQAKHTTPDYQVVAVKVFEDGVVEGHTAYLLEPYADGAEYAGDADYRGYPLWDQDALNAAFAAIDKAGFQIHVHSIGDAATEATLDAMAYARHKNGAHDWRPGITHIQLVAPSDIQRFADLGVTAVPQPYWFEKDDYYTYLQVPYLGLPRADLEYPMKSFFDAGALVASSSDFPVTYPPDPLDAIQTGVQRWFPGLVWEYPPPPSLEGVLWPEERVSVDQMIRSFTINGAKAYYLESRKGSIEVGKDADLVLINRDITTCAPELIGQSKALLTLFEGKRVFGLNGF